MIIKESYFEDIRYFDEPYKRWWTLAFVVFLFFLPLLLDTYFIYLVSLACIYIISAVGLNLLMGYCGQMSMGQVVFVSLGAYLSTFGMIKLEINFFLCLPIAGILTTIIGLIVGIPALRMKGIYLAIMTMGLVFINEEAINLAEPITNGADGLFVPTAEIFGFAFDNDNKMYLLILAITIIMVVMAKNLVRSRIGRAFTAIRDSEIAAESMGIKLSKYKVVAFGLSAFYAGIAGCLYAQLLTFIGPENFTLHDAIMYVVMILVGGLGSILGSIMGATFIAFLAEVIRIGKDFLPTILYESKGFQTIIYGSCIVVAMMFEPHGLAGRWQKIKLYWETYPLGKKTKSKKMMVGRARDMSV
ncbi:branched-chain amino acid ABC transporter permease [Thermodesulfobacteriota bacterium]